MSEKLDKIIEEIKDCIDLELGRKPDVVTGDALKRIKYRFGLQEDAEEIFNTRSCLIFTDRDDFAQVRRMFPKLRERLVLDTVEFGWFVGVVDFINDKYLCEVLTGPITKVDPSPITESGEESES